MKKPFYTPFSQEEKKEILRLLSDSSIDGVRVILQLEAYPKYTELQEEKRKQSMKSISERLQELTEAVRDIEE